MTKLEIATEIVAIIGGDAEQLAEKHTAKDLKRLLKEANAEANNSIATDSSEANWEKEEVQKAINNAVKTATIEPSDKELELVDIVIKNNVVTFVYSDESTEEVKFKKGMREIVNTLIRNANYDLTIASKPEPKKDIIQNIRNLTYTRICRIALALDKVKNAEARELFNAPVSDILAHQAVDAIVIKNIADSFCEVEKLGRL